MSRRVAKSGQTAGHAAEEEEDSTMASVSSHRLYKGTASLDHAAGRASSMEAPLLCTVEETARLLNISRTGVYVQLRNGNLRSVKVGGRRLIPRHTIGDFVERLLDAS